jgi:hypothetical protein
MKSEPESQIQQRRASLAASQADKIQSRIAESISWRVARQSRTAITKANSVTAAPIAKTALTSLRSATHPSKGDPIAIATSKKTV